MVSRRFREWSCFAIFILMAGIFGGCNPAEKTFAPAGEVHAGPAARITGTIPRAGEVLGESLTVVFDQPIAPLEGDAAGTGTLPLLIEPRINGNFEYGPNFVHFKAKGGVPQSIFEVRTNPRLAGLTTGTGEVLYFASFEFKPTRLGMVEQVSTRTTLALEFNAAVRAEDLGGRLEIVDRAQQPINHRREAGTNDRTARIVMEGEIAWPVTARVAAGMPDASGRIRTAIDYELMSASGQTLSIAVGHGIQAEAGGQSVTLHATQPVGLAALQGAVKVTEVTGGGARDLATSITALNGEKIYGVRFKAADPLNFRVKISVAPLKSTNGLAMERGIEEERSARIALEIGGAHWDADSNPPQVRVQLNHAPEPDEFRRAVRLDPPVEGLKIEADGGNYFRLAGNWKKNTSYQLRLEPGVRFFGWARTDRALTFRLGSFKSLPPRLEFPMKEKYYFPRRYGHGIPLETRGLEGVDVKLYRVFPSNLPLAIEDIGRGERDYYNYGMRGSDSRLRNKWSELIAEKRISVNHDEFHSTYTTIGLDRLTSAPLRGIYCIAAGAEFATEEYSYYHERMRIVLLTNLGVLAHWQDDQLVLFAHHLFTLAPATGAKVSIYSEKNQLLGEAQTDARGIARLRNFKKSLGTPRVAVVESAGDSTYLRLDAQSDGQTAVDYADPLFDAAEYDAFIYADRELYRPGETAHLRWIVRQGYGNALTSAPLTLEITKPGGSVIARETLRLNEWGTAGYDFATLKTHPTGRYTATLKVPGGGKIIGNYEFQIEEFVPNRMKATVTTAKPLWVKGEGPFGLRVKAEHLFGGAATSRTAELQLDFSRGHTFEKWPDYQFNNDSPDVYVSAARLGEKRTDANGEAEFLYDGAQLGTLSYPVRVRAAARVHELGGRAVAANATVTFFPTGTLIGMAARPGEGREEVEIRLAAIRPDQTPAEGVEAQVTLERMAWDYYVRRYYSHYSAQWSDRYEAVETRTVRLENGQGALTFSAADYGYYRVTARVAGSPQYCTQFFRASGGRPRISKQPQQSLIKLQLDKGAVKAGESVRLRIESPFDGKAIVVVQHGSLKRVLPVTIANQSGEIELTAARDWAPNVWIEATVIHAVEEGRKQVYPFASFAMTPLKVIDPGREIKVTMSDLPVELTPGSRAAVKIETRDEAGRGVAAEVTLAAVDEGIHSITGYRKPDPLEWFARRRRPDLRRANYYDLIAEKWQPPTPGGDGEGVSRRIGRAGQNWIKTVALWSGVVRTGADGRATVPFDIPEFNGRLRFVAVAASARATGSAEAQVFVRRPWMMQTSMPRFLLPGDDATCRATLYNTTASSCSAQISWATSGTLTLAEPTSGTTLALAPGGEASLTMRVKAQEMTGSGAIIWRARIVSAAGEGLGELSETAALPVAEPAAYETRSTVHVIKAGETATFEAAEFLQNDWTGIELTAGGDPLLRLRKSLQFVLGYPYGCVEQTTSKLMPLYLLRKNAGLIETTLGEKERLDDYLRFGIDRLFSMQTAAGGLGGWPGAQDPYPYGSIYALHFLTLAKNGREVPIDDQKLELLREYVRGLTADAFDDSPSGIYRRAYAIYVLTLGGDADAVAQIQRFDQMRVPRAARYLLAGALAVATRDTDRVRLYMGTAPMFEHDTREYDGTLQSPMRNRAVELLSMVEVGGAAAEIARTADLLIRDMESAGYLTTQEQAFAIAALCNYMETLGTRIDLVRAGIEWPAGREEISGAQVFRKKLSGVGQRFVVSNLGASDLFVNEVGSGVPATPPGRVEAGASISRRFLNRDGTAAAPGRLEQGETYVVELAIRTEREARQFVVADILPAGLEVENPRLNASAMAGLSLPHAPVQPTHLELRDDRLVLVFDRLEAPGPHYYYYVTNAVTPGEFTHPGVTGECMYDPATRCATETGRVVVGGL